MSDNKKWLNDLATAAAATSTSTIGQEFELKMTQKFISFVAV